MKKFRKGNQTPASPASSASPSSTSTTIFTPETPQSSDGPKLTAPLIVVSGLSDSDTQKKKKDKNISKQVSFESATLEEDNNTEKERRSLDFHQRETTVPPRRSFDVSRRPRSVSHKKSPSADSS